MEYKLSGGNAMRACDRGVYTKRLCARIVRSCGDYKLALFPLPEKFRVGARWDAMDFWLCR